MKKAMMRRGALLLFLLLFSGCALLKAEWIDETHHGMIHDAETKTMALEETARWDRAEILLLQERVKRIEERMP